MRLQTKLLLTIGVVLLLVFTAVEYSSYQDAQHNAVQDLQGQAEKVRAVLMAFRRYQQQVILKYKIEMDDVHLNFLPAFAVGKISQEYPNWDNSGFSFENVSDQPRNPEHAADTIELEAMAYFREHPKDQILFKPFNNPQKNGEEYYLYARPVWTEKYCLACHGKREDAPKLIREKYDTAWNYKEGDLRGLLSIKLPATTIKARAWETFKKGALLHFAGFTCIFFAVLVIIRRTVTHPMSQLEQGMQAVAVGNYTHRLQGFEGEFEKISEGFNNMSLKVNQQQHALQNLNENLEQRVLLRTSELAAAHEKIRRLNEGLQNENIRMAAELEISRQLQQLLLPKPQQLAAITELDIAGFMEAATEVGGDYYDILPHAGHIKLCIGDVVGHGLESGVVMLMVQMAVLTLLENEVTHPETFLNIINRAIFANLQRMNSDKTLTLSLLDYHQGRLQVTGQHEEVLVVRQDGSVERIDTINLGFIVGLKADISAFSKHLELQLAVGDGIVLYTDGITEAHNAQDEMYGIERLCQQISTHWQAGNAEYIQQAVIQELRQYLGTQALEDDITLVVVKRVI
ncbi:MAG: SpoIIE family protein phosphatase [Thiotrichaceae bacterium]|nr:SpoIIE family protein phosphatase [Thiotrichaceae bacterium]